MTDEELVKRLRSWAKDIQAGSTAIYAMDLDLKNAASSIEALTEQLTKAVKALRAVDDEYTDQRWGPELSSIKQVRAIIAEIEGEK